MTNYTPTTEQVRNAYVRGMRDTFIASAGEHREEFDRWVQAHDDEVRASVQPPTREQIAEAICQSQNFGRGLADQTVIWQAKYLTNADAALALFPQSTPKAELGQYAQVAGRTVCVVCWRFDGEHEDMPAIGHVGTPSAEPVSIADMAPGTRFVGDTHHGSRTFMVTIDSIVAAESGLSYFPEDIDPSTIRDVTPPPATPKEGDRG